MKYVHESCLIMWLTTHSRDHQMRCELCLQEYKIAYVFDSLSNNLRKGFNYAVKDKKRLACGFLYALYLWIFIKRFIIMIKSLFRLMNACLLTLLRVFQKLGLKLGSIFKAINIIANKKVALVNVKIEAAKMVPAKDQAKQKATTMIENLGQSKKNSVVKVQGVIRPANSRLARLFSIGSMVTTLFAIMGFLYRLFIFNQMCILFYAETKRIKKYMNFLITNSKKLTILPYKENDGNANK